MASHKIFFGGSANENRLSSGSLLTQNCFLQYRRIAKPDVHEQCNHAVVSLVVDHLMETATCRDCEESTAIGSDRN